MRIINYCFVRLWTFAQTPGKSMVDHGDSGYSVNQSR